MPRRAMCSLCASDVRDLTYPTMEAEPHQIKIEVETAYLDEQSDPKETPVCVFPTPSRYVTKALYRHGS